MQVKFITKNADFCDFERTRFEYSKSKYQPSCWYITNLAGGTFALYSLICRYAKINLLPNRQQADERISSFRLKLPTPELERALNIKEKLEHNSFYKTLLLLLVLMGTSMIIGDGILTPAISGKHHLFVRLSFAYHQKHLIIGLLQRQMSKRISN